MSTNLTDDLSVQGKSLNHALNIPTIHSASVVDTSRMISHDQSYQGHPKFQWREETSNADYASQTAHNHESSQNSAEESTSPRNDSTLLDRNTSAKALRSHAGDILRMKDVLSSSRKRSSTHRRKLWAQLDEFEEDMKLLNRATKKLASRVSSLLDAGEDAVGELTAVIKKVRSKVKEMEKHLRQMEVNNRKMGGQEKQLISAEGRLYTLCEALLNGKPTAGIYGSTGQSRDIDSPSTHSSKAELIHPLVLSFYDKIGDAKLVAEKIYNLEADFKLQKMYRDYEKEEGDEMSFPDTEFYQTYFTKREQLLRQFSATKEAALEFYAQCLEENLEVEEFDLPPLDPRVPEEPYAVESLHSERVNENFRIWRSKLRPEIFGVEPGAIAIDRWRATIPLHAEPFESYGDGDSLLESKDILKRGRRLKNQKQTSNVSSRLETTSDVASAWEFVSQEDGHDIHQRELAPVPSRKPERYDIQDPRARFVGEKMRHIYSEPDLFTLNRSKTSHRLRTHSASLPKDTLVEFDTFV